MTHTLIALKLLLSPSLVLLAWWLGRRFGPGIGGRTAALPIVAGPIMLVLALAQGPVFASQAAKFALLGILPLSLFGVAYASTARALRASLGRSTITLLCTLSGWCVFGATAAAMQMCADAVFTDPGELPLIACIVIALLAIAATPRLIAAVPDDGASPHRHHLSAEVGGRVLGAMSLVATLTTVAAALGANWSGLLASFPVALSVVAVASHISDGPTTVRPIFRGYLHGLYGYAAFLTLFSWIVTRHGLAWALLISWPAAPAVQWLHHTLRSPQVRKNSVVRRAHAMR